MAEDIAPNLERINRITPETDLDGNRLEIGCRVRVFHFYFYCPEMDICAGVSLESVSQGYYEGILLAIGSEAPAQHGGAGPRYTIRADLDVFPEQSGPGQPPRTARHMVDQLIYPPVNGTPVGAMGWKTFGVFRIAASASTG